MRKDLQGDRFREPGEALDRQSRSTPVQPAWKLPEAVCIINLKRRRDRRKAMEKQVAALQRDGQWPFPDPFWVFAMDASQLRLDRMPLGWRNLPRGAFGCSLSMRGLLRHAQVTGRSSVLILEDDVIFAEDFGDRWREFLISAPADWECLMLAGQHVRPPDIVGPLVVRCVRTERTWGFLVRGEAINLLYQAWQQPGHIDQLMARVLGPRRRTYAPADWLLRPSGSPSDISS